MEERVAATSRLATSFENPSVSQRWMRHDTRLDGGMGTLDELGLGCSGFLEDTSCLGEVPVPESAGLKEVATMAVLATLGQQELPWSGLLELCLELWELC